MDQCKQCCAADNRQCWSGGAAQTAEDEAAEDELLEDRSSNDHKKDEPERLLGACKERGEFSILSPKLPLGEKIKSSQVNECAEGGNQSTDGSDEKAPPDRQKALRDAARHQSDGLPDIGDALPRKDEHRRNPDSDPRNNIGDGNLRGKRCFADRSQKKEDETLHREESKRRDHSISQSDLTWRAFDGIENVRGEILDFLPERNRQQS